MPNEPPYRTRCCYDPGDVEYRQRFEGNQHCRKAAPMLQEEVAQARLEGAPIAPACQVPPLDAKATTSIRSKQGGNSMNALTELPSIKRGPRHYELRQDVEDFLYREVELLDQRRFKDWLGLLTDDVIYFMPIRRNVKFGQHDERENTKVGQGISWFGEDKWTLTKRVADLDRRARRGGTTFACLPHRQQRPASGSQGLARCRRGDNGAESVPRPPESGRV
jgi:3-phenylpropionate/cinnamic acid dioxygenase small subunit